MKDSYGDSNEDIKKLNVCFNLRQCHDNEFEKWSRFSVGDIYVKGE